jgi:hypothetical protein
LYFTGHTDRLIRNSWAASMIDQVKKHLPGDNFKIEDYPAETYKGQSDDLE